MWRGRGRGHRCRDLLVFNGRYAMKCLDKKRIKMKQGETLALNERIMLSLVSTGVSATRTRTLYSNQNRCLHYRITVFTVVSRLLCPRF